MLLENDPRAPRAPPGSMGIPSESCYFIEILRQDRAEKESIWAPRCVPFWALPPGSAPNIVFSIILILLLQHWALETLRYQFLGHEVSF